MRLDQPLADRVIGVFLKARLLSREFLEFAFGRPGLFLLQIATAMFKDAPISVNVCSAEVLSIRIGGDIHNPQIHTQNPLHVNRFRPFYITSNEEVELAFDVT